jgi:hypothetical protein
MCHVPHIAHGHVGMESWRRARSPRARVLSPGAQTHQRSHRRTHEVKSQARCVLMPRPLSMSLSKSAPAPPAARPRRWFADGVQCGARSAKCKGAPEIFARVLGDDDAWSMLHRNFAGVLIPLQQLRITCCPLLHGNSRGTRAANR